MISGIVITTERDERAVSHVKRAIGARPEIELGESNGVKLPATLEADDESSARELVDWIQQIPGVSQVDVVCVHFDP